MDLRINQQTMINQALAGLEQQTTRMGQLQEEASTGKQILQPSDNPVGTVALLAAQAQDQQTATYLGNIQTAQGLLNAGVSVLRQAGSILSQAQGVAEQAANAATDPSFYETLAQQVDALLGQLVSVANTNQNGQYLFSGTASQTAPFAVTATDGQGRPLAVTYQGSDQPAQVATGPQQTVNTRYAGSQLFQANQRQTTVYTGNTGAAAGTGTDSAVGRGTLLVRHTSTTYAPGSGVKAGTDSAAGDTVLGPAGAHTLTVTDTSGTGASGTVSLDGGPAVAFTGADTNLRVTGPNGQVVYLDTTAITPGFQGTVDVTAGGTLSVDGGATSVPITFSANQVVTDGKTGAVTNVDSTRIRQAGTDALDYPGTEDAFQVLMRLRDTLRNAAGLSQHDQQQALSGLVGELQRVQTGVLRGVGEQSASLQGLSAAQGYLQNFQLNTQAQETNLQGADIAQVVVNLQAEQNQLQLSLAATARIFDLNLLNFLH